MCLDGAGLDIPFDPVVKDWSVERSHWDESCTDYRAAGERQWLGGKSWGYMSNYLARNGRRVGQLKEVGEDIFHSHYNHQQKDKNIRKELK